MICSLSELTLYFENPSVQNEFVIKFSEHGLLTSGFMITSDEVGLLVFSHRKSHGINGINFRKSRYYFGLI